MERQREYGPTHRLSRRFASLNLCDKNVVEATTLFQAKLAVVNESLVRRR